MGIALTEGDRITFDTSSLRNWKEEEEDNFRPKFVRPEEEDNSGASTPPLWSPSRSKHYQGFNHPGGFRTMSPNSRAQAIARGQRELMEMVSRMPEACYELSLKDIVEHQHPLTVVEAEQEMDISNSKVVPGRDHQKSTEGGLNGRSASSGRRSSTVSSKEGKNNNKKEKKAVVVSTRSGSFNNGGGLFLKMIFPVSFGSTKNGRLRSNSKGRGICGGVVGGRVSPRPLLLREEEGTNRYKDGDGHWWTKVVAAAEEEGVGKESLGFSSSGKSRSSKSTRSSSSTSSSSNSTRQANFSCWSCIYSNKGKKRAA